MPARLSPEEIMTIEVLLNKGVPGRQVARELGVTEGAVRYHKRRRESGAVDGRRDKEFAAVALEPVIAEYCERTGSSERPPNVRDLYEYLVREHGYASSYKSVLRFVRSRYGVPKLRTFRRVETPPGAQAQTDWGVFNGLCIGDGPQRLSAFVMVLGFSRMPAIVWSEREDQTAWISCHNNAFMRLGGIPAVNRIDNPKTAMSHGAGAHGTVHPVYASYARSVGFHVDPCAPRQPQQKGKTEAKVKLARHLVEPMGRSFCGIEDLQARTDESVESWSKRALCPATGETVAASFEHERGFLRPLPLLPEPFDVSVLRKVHRDCLVHFEGRQYAVPFRFAGREVEVRGCARHVQIVADGEVQKSYPRGTAERLLIDPDCYEGRSTERVQAPPPLGRLGRRLQAICEMPVERRPLDLYAALAEGAAR